jgi:hypothetical protein
LVFFIAPLLSLALPKTAGALDFGLVITQSSEYTNTSVNTTGDKGTPGYTGTYIPWVSGEWRNGALRFYASMKLTMTYEAEMWKYRPFLAEAGRTELVWQPLPALFLEAGRIRFEEPSGLTASGLFDGVRGNLTAGRVRFVFDALYTGFLYKGTAKIVMNDADAERYALPPDYTDSGTYFASRRVLLSAGVEFPDLTRRSALTLNGLAQFDVNDNGGSSFLHSQYFSAVYACMPLETLRFVGRAVAALAEQDAEDPFACFAASGGIEWEVPGTAIQDMVQTEVRWASGKVNKHIGTFIPVKGTAQGEIFTPRLSALMTAKGTYTARLHRTFSVQAGGTYFLRTDGETVSAAEYPASSSRALGGELYGSLVWAPVSDLMARVGGGAFFPRWGNVFKSGTPVRWKIAAGVIVSL